ncbi:MAG TPA: undecaprenyl-diphosphate phosphatase [Candidatus Paceibacterota bacterium]|nr:undecaprenyl-diphosphate phosphatase [Candidatus Paceibacterota bacterium]
MTYLHAIILGLVEGITEFLPISSTGHLVLTGKLLGLEADAFLTTFDIAIQLGAILAVLTLYGNMLLRKPSVIARIAVAFIPTGALGLVLYPFVKEWLGNPAIVVWALGIGGLVLIVFERFIPEPADAGEDIAHLGYGKSFMIGLAQAVAMVPGVSRAAATIIGGLALGMSRRAIVEFSFLLALPTMAAATGLDLYQNMDVFSRDQFGMLAIGFVLSWLTAALSIRWLLRFIQRHDFTSFGVYRIILAVAFALLVLY